MADFDLAPSSAVLKKLSAAKLVEKLISVAGDNHEYGCPAELAAYREETMRRLGVRKVVVKPWPGQS